MSTGTSNPENRRAGTNPVATTRPATRNETKRAGTTVSPPAAVEDIRDATEGRAFLEERLLLCPAGEPASNASIAVCLHQISKMKGMNRQTSNAIRAVSFLIEEMEETAINTTVRDAVITQLNELTLDMRSLVTDAKEKIDEHLQKTPTATYTAATPPQPPYGTRSYAEALVTAPPHANPKLAAREGIRARQFMLEGPERGSKVSQMNGMQLKNEFNRILGSLGRKEKGIRSALPQKHKGVLFETDDDSTANWLRKKDNAAAFCSAIGPNVAFKPRTHNLIAFNVALTLDPDNQRHREEICEANHLDEDAILAMRSTSHYPQFPREIPVNYR